ncbi:MAG TPA: amidase [Methylomirabilota bacterium]|jgi:aspartyl-tRNA(Asn)/glutamyl-tRNA(Gln) amidotransferase subunit A|nr:amidase [Methylomirabilota bacterium]
MAHIDPAWATIAELSRAFADRTLSPVDVVEALLDRIRKRDGALHAYIAVYEADARLAAEAADKAIRSGHRVGPLHGVPIALKDLVDLEGRVTTGGSKVWEKRVSPVTATLAERLIAAGTIVLGKTHTVEFAMGSFGTNTHLGTPRNPWDASVHRTPGGSSSGSAVAVSAGMTPMAIGTDTGGSVRLPAGWCGIVGLKVTAGRISTHGVLPLSSTLDTPGPLTRSVEDAALIFRLLNGPDPRDAQTLAWAPADPMPELRRGVAGLRLAVMPDVERAGVAADVLAAYDASIDALARLGAQIVRPALPHRFADYATATGRIIGAEGYRFVGHLVDDMSLPVDPHIRPRIQLGRNISARDYLLALSERQEHCREFAAALAGVDALLTPVALTAAMPIDQVDQSTTAAHFTRPGNYLGLCGLAVPNGFTPGGLPTSLQILGHAGQESTILRIGWAYEQATDWHSRRPPGA